MTKYFYYNRNPNYVHITDCVCRAISTATELKYDVINRLLELVATVYECDKLCVCCYKYLLSNVFGYKKYYCNNNETVLSLARKYKHNILIIRIDSHLTCAINGNVYDIWDCSDELVDCFWIVK